MKIALPCISEEYVTSLPCCRSSWCVIIFSMCSSVCIGIMNMGYRSGAAVSVTRSEPGKSSGTCGIARFRDCWMSARMRSTRWVTDFRMLFFEPAFATSDATSRRPADMPPALLGEGTSSAVRGAHEIAMKHWGEEEVEGGRTGRERHSSNRAEPTGGRRKRTETHR